MFYTDNAKFQNDYELLPVHMLKYVGNVPTIAMSIASFIKEKNTRQSGEALMLSN